MEFPSLDPNNNYIYIKFATLKSNSLLMYNHDNQTGDKAEFLALEIFEGRMRFSFNLGSGTYKLMTMIKVSDGQFHTVIARRAGMVRIYIFMVEISLHVRCFSSCILGKYLIQWLNSSYGSSRKNIVENLLNATQYGLTTQAPLSLAFISWVFIAEICIQIWPYILFAPSDDN